MKLLQKKANLISLLVLLVFLTANNFFYNFYYTLKVSYSKRMNFHYGYCDRSGYGFIKYINEKYNLKKNIKILNFVQKPSSEWFFYNSNENYYSNKIILLNKNNLFFDMDGISKINFGDKAQGNYKVIENYQNCFFLEKIND